jgi:hypothetical protein
MRFLAAPDTGVVGDGEGGVEVRLWLRKRVEERASVVVGRGGWDTLVANKARTPVIHITRQAQAVVSGWGGWGDAQRGEARQRCSVRGNCQDRQGMKPEDLQPTGPRSGLHTRESHTH